MNEEPLHVAVIVGSTRQGRFGGVVADWFVGQARRRGDIDVDVIDLADEHLPADLPSYGSRHTPEVAAYRERIDQADAYVVVTPEYNHGYPAALKQAIDLAHDEWKAKPLGFVSYGGLAAGLRAVEQLRQVFAELHVATIRDTVSFPMFFDLFDDAGQPKDPTGPAAAATVMLDQLTWWADALRAARHARNPVEAWA